MPPLHDRTPRRLAAAFVALSIALAAPSAWAMPADFRIDAAELEEAAARARAAVERELDVDLTGWSGVRLASARDVEDALNLELVAQFDLQFDDPEEAARARTQFARQYAPNLLGKYSVGAREILIVPENFERLAQLLDVPELLGPDVLYAILAHESVHAAQEKQFQWSARAAKVESTEALQAFNAVIEGHAQVIARRVCADEPARSGFEVFTRCIGAVPEGGSGLEQMTARVLSATAAMAYHDGERFIAHLLRVGGDAAVARAFREPPRTLDDVFRPEWYLDPSSRPADRFDLAAGLAIVLEWYPAADFTHQEITLLRPQLEAALSILPNEDVSAALDPLVDAAARLVGESNDGDGTFIPALMEFETADDAYRFLLVQERVLHAKDEVMKDGPVRIESATYEDVERGPVRGVYAAKVLVAGVERLTTKTLVAARGPLSIEISAVALDLEVDDLIAMGVILLERTLRPSTPSEPTEPNDTTVPASPGESR